MQGAAQMRFALFTTNLAGGGAEKALGKVGTGLAMRGHEVDFIVCEDQGNYHPPLGCRFHALAQRVTHGWLGKRLLAWHLSRRLRRQPYNVLISTLPFADEVAALARLPRHVCRIANTLGAEIDNLAARHPRKAQRRLSRYRKLYGDTSLVAVSDGVASDLQERLGARRIATIPNPFDFLALRRAATADFRPARPYVIHVGRFSAQKRHDLLLDAWARQDTHRELVLLAAPDVKLQAMIDERGLKDCVRIAGFQQNPYPWIAQADLLVLCSDHEGLPNVLIEALACGTPVISTDCPSGPREILASFPDCLVPCGDAPALAAAIARALAGPPDAVLADLSRYEASAVLDAYEQLALATTRMEP